MTDANLERRAPEWFFKTCDQFPWWKRIIWKAFGERRLGTDDTEFGRVQVIGYKLNGITLIEQMRFLDWERR